jgi:hypothetical protein
MARREEIEELARKFNAPLDVAARGRIRFFMLCEAEAGGVGMSPQEWMESLMPENKWAFLGYCIGFELGKARTQ